MKNLPNMLLIFYGVLLAPFYLYYPAMVYDEAWFYTGFGVNKLENHLGYGGGYWFLLNAVKSIFGKAGFFILRIISLMAAVSIARFVYLAASLNKNRTNPALVLLLFLTFPSVWWMGKLISVELIALAIGSGGLYLVIKQCQETFRLKLFNISIAEATLGWILLGFAAGLKINYLVLGVFGFLLTANYKVLFSEVSHRKALYYSMLGYVVASPNILFDPIGHVNNIIKFSKNQWGLDFSALYGFNLGRFWETVESPSLLSFSLQLPTLALLCLILVRGVLSGSQIRRIIEPRLIWALGFTFMVFLALISRSQIYLAWYAFPMILILIVSIGKLSLSNRALIFLVLLNITFSLPLILAQIYTKFQHIQNAMEREQINKFVAEQENFAYSRHPDCKFEKIISIDPPNGSSIIRLNDLVDNKGLDGPVFIAVSKVMLVAYGNPANAILHLQSLWGGDRFVNFEQRLSANISVDYFSRVCRDDVCVFVVIPKAGCMNGLI